MKKIITLCLAICLLFAATSCNMIVNNSDDSQFDYPVTVGNIVFEKEPENVVVLSDNLADIIVACGYEGKLAARSDVCTQAGLEVLPSVGTPDNPDIDMIEKLGATLVLGDQSFDYEIKEEFEKLGIDVLIIKPAVNENEIKTLYGNVASILGGGYTGKMKAMTVDEEIRDQLDSIKNEIVDSNVVSTVCYIYNIEGDHCRVACGNDYTSQMFDYAQLTNIAIDSEIDEGYIGFDTLLKGNPDTIFCDESLVEVLKSNTDLQSLSAVIDNRIYTLPRKYIRLQGTTRVTTVDYLAAKTHDFYTPKTAWPEEFSTVETVVEDDYIPPFEPKENIFYTVGENYSQIKFVEERLIQLGYMQGEADTAFTQETADAVAQFQQMNELEVTGIADYNTLIVLLSKYAVAAQ